MSKSGKSKTFFCILAGVAILGSTLVFSGCQRRKMTPKEKYESDPEGFQWLADTALSYSNIDIITRDNPTILPGDPYKKVGKLYYRYTGKGLDKSQIDAEGIYDVFKRHGIVQVFPYHDKGIVGIQLAAGFGWGEYLIYTKDGSEAPDKYMHAVEWLSDTWYVGQS